MAKQRRHGKRAADAVISSFDGSPTEPTFSSGEPSMSGSDSSEQLDLEEIPQVLFAGVSVPVELLDPIVERLALVDPLLELEEVPHPADEALVGQRTAFEAAEVRHQAILAEQRAEYTRLFERNQELTQTLTTLENDLRAVRLESEQQRLAHEQQLREQRIHAAELELQIGKERNQHALDLAQMMTDMSQRFQAVQADAERQLQAAQADADRRVSAVYANIQSMEIWQFDRSSGRRELVFGSNHEDASRRLTTAHPETADDRITGSRTLNQKIII